MKLRLRAGLQAEVVLCPVGYYLIDDGLHLIDFYRVDNIVLTLEVILHTRLVVALGNLLDAIVQDVGETQQHWWSDVAQGQLIHDVAEVYLYVILAWCDIHMTFAVDAEIGCSPSFYIIQLLRVLYGPFLHLNYSYESFFITEIIYH